MISHEKNRFRLFKAHFSTAFLPEIPSGNKFLQVILFFSLKLHSDNDNFSMKQEM